ncbi:hypothetical protein P40081_15230 [Paenibacillus sp. FSL P4-0081]|uniref:hypothetical protein n=1 Tax=Paenibacillus sp. FSL P4-0081 TaxID=1536769 RepID=UPI0004F75C15|nr:hypothetical protein [Paenibacillus sp. FSL P4-0081]AIQ29350.1 hypothetical protein P40081_15230 [Paenibacillus sp. FSL P4-0081]
MRLNEIRLELTDHAHQQFMERAGLATFEEIRDACREQLAAGDYKRDGEFIKINDAWWIFTIREEMIVLITCYGNSHFDVPRALAWARRHDDRITLDNFLNPEAQQII